MNPDSEAASTAVVPSPAAHESSRAGTSWSITAAETIGRTVVTADGQRIGTVINLGIEVSTWRVTSMEVRLDRPMHRTLGVKREMVHRTTLNLPTQLVHAVKDAVVLTTTTAELRERAADSSTTH